MIPHPAQSFDDAMAIIDEPLNRALAELHDRLRRKKAADLFRDRATEQKPLQSESPERTSPDMDAGPDQSLVDAKIAAAEARTDTKFAQLMSKIDMLTASVAGLSSGIAEMKADNKNTRTTVIVTGLTSTFAIVTIVIAVLAYGAATFYNGTVVFDHRAAQSAPAK